jgi:hypothetical protein
MSESALQMSAGLVVLNVAMKILAQGHLGHFKIGKVPVILGVHENSSW